MPEITNKSPPVHLIRGEPPVEPSVPRISLTDHEKSFIMHPDALVEDSVPKLFKTWKVDLRDARADVDFAKFDPGRFQIFRQREARKLEKKN